jgi:hypothetical protein
MLFVLITFLAAFLIEGLGTLVSVIGLSTLFGANPIIIALAISLDVGKLVVVSMLYKYGKEMGKVMKTYAFIAATITMIITSAGAAGYLSGEFQKAIMGTQEGSLKVSVLKDQQKKYEDRKRQIDDQIAALPEKTTVNQRLKLMNGFKAEQAELQNKISDIDKQLPELQIHQIGVEAKAGPILYIAKAFDIPVESAVKYVILMIIFVFDPLAVYLILAGNFLLDRMRRLKEKAGIVQEEPKEAEDQRQFPANYGFVAQEVADVLPEAITKEYDAQQALRVVDLADFEPINQEHNLADALREYEPPVEPVVVQEKVPEPAPPVPQPVVIEEPIIEAEPVQPATPDEAERTLEKREEITLDDLIPARSSLNDINLNEPGSNVVFDSTPQAVTSRHYI